MSAFQSNAIAHRSYVIGVFPDDRDHFPFELIDEHHELILIDLSCRKNIEQLIMQTRNKMKNHIKWVFMSSGVNDVSMWKVSERRITVNSYTQEATMDVIILNLLADCPILPRSEIFLICTEGENIIFKQGACPFVSSSSVFDFRYVTVYRVAMSEPLLFQQFGVYANGAFIDGRGKDGPVRRRQNLNGITLRASMVMTDNDTINHLDDYM